MKKLLGGIILQVRKKTTFPEQKSQVSKENLEEWLFNEPHLFFVEDLDEVLTAINSDSYYNQEKKAILHRANRLLKYQMVFDEEWDMERCPTPYEFTFPLLWEKSQNGDPEWMWMLNRQKYLITLAKAYTLTKEKKYIHLWKKFVLDWLQYHTKSFPEYRATTSRTLDTGMRLRNWCYCLDLFSQQKELKEILTNEFLQLMFISMLEQIDYLQTATLSDTTPISNWKVLEMNGVSLVSLFLSSLIDTKEDLNYALSVLKEALSLQFNQDGFHWEQSFMYHNDVFMCFLEVSETLRRKKISSPFNDQLAKILATVIAITKPNKKQSPVGDSDEENLQSLLTYSALCLNNSQAKFLGEDIVSLENLFHYGSSALKNYSILKSEKPKNNYLNFTTTGFVFTHSSWEADETYTMFKATPQGGGHGHCDFGHFEIQKGSDYLLSDSGRFTYLEGSKIRKDFKGASFHNTTTMDNIPFTEQTGSWSFGKVAHGLPIYEKRISNKAYIEATHLGYFNEKNSVVTQRKIFYLSESLWLITDLFQTKEKHTYQQYFNFPDKKLTKINQSHYEYLSKHHHKLNLIFPSFETIDAHLETSFYSPDYNVKKESSRLKIDFKNNMNSVLMSLDEEAKIISCPVKNLGGKIISPEYVSAWHITAPSFEGYVVMTHKEDQFGSSRKSYTVDDFDVFGQAVVIDSQKSNYYQFKG